MTKRTCSITACGRPAKARGWCRSHYMRWYATGVVDDTPLAVRDPGRGCKVDGCDLEHSALGYCAPHYKRVLKDGQPGPAEIRPRTVGDKASYALIHARLKKKRGRAGDAECIDCYGPAQMWAYDHTDPDEKRDPKTGAYYSVDLERYSPMCAPCHKRFDLDRIAQRRTKAS